MTNLLKKKMGYRGLILSDDLEMGAIVGGMDVGDAARQSLAAGADRILVCQHFEVYVGLVGA